MKIEFLHDKYIYIFLLILEEKIKIVFIRMWRASGRGYISYRNKATAYEQKWVKNPYGNPRVERIHVVFDSKYI